MAKPKYVLLAGVTIRTKRMNPVESRIRALAGVIAATVVISISSAEEYDLVITGGRVIDPETQFDGIAKSRICSRDGGRRVSGR